MSNQKLSKQLGSRVEDAQLVRTGEIGRAHV